MGGDGGEGPSTARCDTCGVQERGREVPRREGGRQAGGTLWFAGSAPAQDAAKQTLLSTVTSFCPSSLNQFW